LGIVTIQKHHLDHRRQSAVRGNPTLALAVMAQAAETPTMGKDYNKITQLQLKITTLSKTSSATKMFSTIHPRIQQKLQMSLCLQDYLQDHHNFLSMITSCSRGSSIKNGC